MLFQYAPYEYSRWIFKFLIQKVFCHLHKACEHFCVDQLLKRFDMSKFVLTF